MGNGVSAQIPDSIDKENAKALLGEKFDESKFDAAAKDGVVDKATFLAAVEEAAKAEAGPTAEGGESSGAAADAGATAAAAAGDGGGSAEQAAAPAAAAAGDYAPDADDTSKADVEALHSQVRWNKDTDAIKEVFKANPAMVHARDGQNGNYPLHIAAQNNHVNLVKLLLENKANPNKQNLAGQTALHMTQTYEMEALSDLLLNAGADPDLKNGDGHAAKHGLEGKQNSRYGQLKKLIESPSEEALLATFSGVSCVCSTMMALSTH